jgi:hypothetical protein
MLFCYQTEDELPGKPVYCLGGIQWGAYRDAYAKKDKYWYWGMLRSYVTYIFMGLKSEESGVSWQCKGHLSYVLPCKGCSKCVQAVENDKSARRWWHVFVQRQGTDPGNTDIVISLILWHFHQCDKAFSIFCLPLSSPFVLGFSLSMLCILYILQTWYGHLLLGLPRGHVTFSFFPRGILMSLLIIYDHTFISLI